MSDARRPGPTREQLSELKTLRAYELATEKMVAPRRSAEMSDVCKHGSLARSCEICERDREIERLKQHIAEIEQLHREHLEEVEAARGVWISEEQIDEMWSQILWFRDENRNTEADNIEAVVAELGIVACKKVPDGCAGTGISLGDDCPDCHGHGWIKEERGDE